MRIEILKNFTKQMKTAVVKICQNAEPKVSTIDFSEKEKVCQVSNVGVEVSLRFFIAAFKSNQDELFCQHCFLRR